jgi:hypothetical protein
MSRFSQSDVLVELVDLATDLITETRQQLNYYRASIYKDETTRQVRERVENLRTIAELLADEALLDAFADHDEMLARGASEYVPGECSFSKRSGRLMTDLQSQFETLMVRHQQAGFATIELQDRLREFRNDIVSMCRHGSRHWSFFQSLK